MRQQVRTIRRGAAAAELAVVLPVLMFVLIITFDWARVFYYSLTVANCARQGALYGSDPIAAARSPYARVQQAALADAANLAPAPTVTSSNGTDGAGNPYIAVTVTWPFSTVSSYPGITTPVTLTSTIRMRIAPTTPQ